MEQKQRTERPNPQMASRVRPESGPYPPEGACDVREPAMLTRAREIESFVSSLQYEMTVTDSVLFGNGSKLEPQDIPNNMEALLANICTRLACAVGHARTMNARLEDRPSAQS